MHSFMYYIYKYTNRELSQTQYQKRSRMPELMKSSQNASIMPAWKLKSRYVTKTIHQNIREILYDIYKYVYIIHISEM